MNEQIKPSVTNPTIADIYEKIENGRLVLNPDFQRKFVWTHEHQEQFIETILCGYPFPEIYVCKGDTDTKKLRTSQKVIDGQQRLTTIVNYIEDNFDKALSKIKKFADLDEEEREAFLSYQLVFRDLGKIDDSVVREIFRRINLTKFKLDDIEIHNAIYDGKFIKIAKELSSEIDLQKYGVFYESEFTRMADTYFFLLVMSTLEHGGYYTGNKELENYTSKFNEEYANSKSIKAQILNSFTRLDKLELALDSIWFRKSNFFTIIIELAKLTIVPQNLKTKLNTFENSILNNKTNSDSDYGVFYGAMYSGTNSRKSRVTRSELLIKHVIRAD